MTLPRPNIDVQTTENSGKQNVGVTISREQGKSITHTGEGTNVSEAVKDVVGKILGDHRSAEFID